MTALSYAEPYVGAPGRNPWDAVRELVSAGSAFFIDFRANYGLLLPHVGTSSSVQDRRSEAPAGTEAARQDFGEVAALPVAEQLEEVLAALSLNKSRLAQLLGVSRPTLYEWFRGKEPKAANASRLGSLLRLLAAAGVSGSRPLNARFVTLPVTAEEPALVDVLGAEPIDEVRAVRLLRRAIELGEAAGRRRADREDRLRRLGFDEPDDERRKEQLGTSMALKDWPKPTR